MIGCPGIIKIDLFNDNRGVLGNHDYRVGALTSKTISLGDTVQFNFNPSADYYGNPFDASGIYPLGIHRIIWFVEDGCEILEFVKSYLKSKTVKHQHHNVLMESLLCQCQLPNVLIFGQGI
ncbi:MAG: hypothetical protein IPJ83_01720 [Saprospiraceae bacterium]|nr:hypothetical protein [Candidatus Vicinibacter proximus]